MAYVPMNRVRALVIVHEPRAYAPSRVQEAAAYLLQSPSATEEESRLATDAIAWLRSKRDEKPPLKTEQVSEPKPAAARQTRKRKA